MNLLISHMFDNFNRRSRLDLDLCVYINSIVIAIVPINFIIFDVSILLLSKDYIHVSASSVYGKLRTYHSLYLNMQPERLSYKVLLIIFTRV